MATNKDVCEAFVAGRRARTSRGVMYVSEAGVLYSFGSHFPLAVKTTKGAAVNLQHYSSRTSRHQSVIQGVLRDKGVEYGVFNMGDMINMARLAEAGKLVHPVVLLRSAQTCVELDQQVEAVVRGLNLKFKGVIKSKWEEFMKTLDVAQVVARL